MGDKLIEAVVTILTALIGVAIIAVLVSKSANTSGLVTSVGSAFATDLSAAISPVSGGSFSGGASLPATF